MSEFRFTAALFDLDDTLHDDTLTYHTAAELTARDVATQRPVDPLRLRDAYIRRAEEFWHNFDERSLKVKMSKIREAMWYGALEDCGVADISLASHCAEAYNRFRKTELRLWPGVNDMLGRLRAAGLRIGIVTNGVSETHREKIALLDLERSVDGVFMADDIGIPKPDPAFFYHAASSLGVEPSRCAMVGDRFARDVMGAHAAGMYAIWLNFRNETAPTGARPPDAEVTQILDVEGLLLQPLKIAP